MSDAEYYLICLMEECDEVSQRASKALRFGPEEVQPGQDNNNLARLYDELCDLRAVWELLDDIGYVPIQTDHERVARKKNKIAKYLEYSKQLGIVAP